MDLLSRLIAGSGAVSSSKQRAHTPAERLAQLKRICTTLQSIWRGGASISADEALAAHVTNQLKRLNGILHDEARKAAPHSCLLYVASSQIYIIVAKLALASESLEIIAEARSFFSFLINSEVEGVLDNKVFARSLVDLVRRGISVHAHADDEKAEADLVELLFEVVTKIKTDPGILPAWFNPERTTGQSVPSSVTWRRHQFPLFYILVDYVHHDGPVGDFARTALLYLTETASRSKLLEKWMIESDLALQMTSGLAALYSRLSRRSPTSGLNERVLPILAFSDQGEHRETHEDTRSDGPSDVQAFLSYLAFWQDSLNYCKSVEVRDTLLDHFQASFVEQLLYPSLLESSDGEGGSTAAVVLHLCRILNAIDHPLLIDRMLQYLFATRSNVSSAEQPQPRKRVSMSRRRSMEYLASLVKNANNPSPDLFNLQDLIVMTLHSSRPQTVTAILKLVSTILHRHHHHVKRQLFNHYELPSESCQQNLNGLNNTMMTMFDLANAISHVSTLDSSYQSSLDDGRIVLERHSCLLMLRETHDLSEAAVAARLGVSGDCKLYRALTDLLKLWFSNDTVVNLELTEVLTALAACETVLFRAWLSPTQAKLQSPSNGMELMTVFKQLVEQVQQWRSQFVEWDAFYSLQRVEVAAHDELATGSRSASTSGRRRGRETSESKHGSNQSSPTPRGRKRLPKGMTSIDSRLTQPPFPGTSSLSKELPASPLSQNSFPGIEVDERKTGHAASGSTSVSETLLAAQIPVFWSSCATSASSTEHAVLDDVDPDWSQAESRGATPTVTNEARPRSTASLRHVLTQAVILQEFMLELAAILQIRATLFDEVDLS